MSLAHLAMRLRHYLYFVICIGLVYFVWQNSLVLSASQQSFNWNNDCELDNGHSINGLVRDANRTWAEVFQGSTTSVEDAAAAYRARRGRHPPSWFDRWYSKAQSLNVVIVEEFFDQIYHDLEPFWAVNPGEIRVSVGEWKSLAKVRKGRVVEIPEGRFRTRVWGDMLKKISSELPDMDLALNGLDEPRVLVPWMTIKERMAAANAQKAKMMSLSTRSFVQDFPESKHVTDVHTGRPKWITKNEQFQKALRQGCPPNSPLTKMGDMEPVNLGKPLVWNVTKSSDICEDPGLTKRHGFLIEPASIDFTTSLVPIFSAAKLGIHNDILLPEPAYYSDNNLFSGKDWLGDWSSYYPWNRKQHQLVWRGASTGGHARTDTWQTFHRHRFVSHLNASNTQIEDAASIQSKLSPDESLPEWIARIADVGFSKILCSGPQAEHICPVIQKNFQAAPSIKMGQQFKWKYLPDIDGNTLSGRFRAFMRSNSAVMKATIFKEWHDSRLFAWKHYIPLDISFHSLYDVMAYFLGIGNTCAHDQVGEKIANDGQKWANTVLRKEDMLVYMHRVLLEYARIVHDERDHLGYVADLLDSEVI